MAGRNQRRHFSLGYQSRTDGEKIHGRIVDTVFERPGDGSLGEMKAERVPHRSTAYLGRAIRGFITSHDEEPARRGAPASSSARS